MADDEYKCEQCGGEFLKTRSDEEAAEESKDIWGEFSEDDLAMVCDDCFKEMMGGLMIFVPAQKPAQ